MSKRAAVIPFLAVTALALAPAAAQPSVSAIPPEGPVRPGQPSMVRYEVRWQGGPDDIAVLPPPVPQVDWGAIQLVASQTSRQGDDYAVRFDFEAVPEQEGAFTIPAFDIPYLRPGDLPPPNSAQDTAEPVPSDLPTLRTEAVSLTASSPPVRLWALAGLAAAALLAGTAAYALRRRRSRRPPANDGPPLEAAKDIALAEGHLRDAQRHRAGGDAYACYAALASAAGALGPAYRDTAERLQARAQDIGYRAAQPSADEIEADLRRMDNLVNRLKEEQTA